MVDLDAYFARIGYEGGQAPSLDVLRRLHALHPASIPFEAIDCLLGRGVDISPAAVDAKLIKGRRGGYCFEHNTLFGRVLESMGFEVQGLAARVRWNMAAEAPAQARTHLVLRVVAEGEPWLVDVGFGGCVLDTPLRLAPGLEQESAHDRYRLRPEGADLRLEVLREPGWLPVYDISLSPCVPRDFEMANWFTSTHPTSRFRHNLMCARTTPSARFGLFLNQLTIRPKGGPVEKRTLDAEGVVAALEDVFGLRVQPEWRPVIEAAVR